MKPTTTGAYKQFFKIKNYKIICRELEQALKCSKRPQIYFEITLVDTHNALTYVSGMHTIFAVVPTTNGENAYMLLFSNYFHVFTCAQLENRTKRKLSCVVYAYCLYVYNIICRYASGCVIFKHFSQNNFSVHFKKN